MGMSRLAVGLAKSPVHSYTPTARTTCWGFATLCIWGKATDAVRVAVPKITRRKRALIVCLTRLDAICGAKSCSGSASIRSMDGAPLLDVRDLSIGFGGQAAVRRISFQINAGETLGLVGESGSGKSAASLAVLRLLPHTAAVRGVVSFDGDDLLGLPEEGMRRRRGRQIAMIFQEPMTALNPVMPVGAQIAEAVQAHHPKLSRKAIKSKVLEAM